MDPHTQDIKNEPPLAQTLLPQTELRELPSGTKLRWPFAKSKKILISGAALLCATALALVLFWPKNGVDEAPRLREYPVEKGNITVGVDASGSIISEKTPQFIEAGLQLERYTVKKGDLVSKGDVIAELSKENAQKKEKEARDLLKSEQFNLAKAQTDKANFIEESEKKLKDTRIASETAYNEKYALLQAKQDLLNANIKQNKSTQEKHEAAIADYDAQKAARPDKLVALTQQIAAVEAEIATVQKQTDDLIADTAATGTDHTAEIAALTEQKIRGEAALLDLNSQKSALEKIDYDAEKSLVQTQLDTLKAELPALQTELEAANAACEAERSLRRTQIDKENSDLELLRKQNAAQIAVYDNTIRLAQISYDLAKEKHKKYQAFAENPNILAAYDGTVLGLGVTAGANTDGTVPVAEYGTKGAKTLTLLVDPVDIVDVSLGQEVSFYVDAYPDASFTGSVKSKSYVQNDAGKFAVTVEYDAIGDYDLLEGMGASATLIVKQKKDVLTLQNKAISLEDGKQYVLVQTSTEGTKPTTEKREIKTGFSDGRVTEIISGLNAGDIVIVEERYEEP